MVPNRKENEHGFYTMDRFSEDDYRVFDVSQGTRPQVVSRRSLLFGCCYKLN